MTVSASETDAVESERPTTPEPPAVQKDRGMPRGRRGGVPMRFLGSLRGQGTLVSPAGETSVSYQLDMYEGGAGRTGGGTLDGDLAAYTEDGTAARLRMSDAREIAVTIQQADEAGALFEVSGMVPPLEPSAR